jgi:hypothetical protein
MCAPPAAAGGWGGGLAERGRQRRVAARPVPEHRQRKGQRRHPLLRPIMEVPLHPAPFGVPGCHDPLPGRPDLLQLGAHLGLQPLVLDGHPGRRRGGA